MLVIQEIRGASPCRGGRDRAGLGQRYIWRETPAASNARIVTFEGPKGHRVPYPVQDIFPFGKQARNRDRRNK